MKIKKILVIGIGNIGLKHISILEKILPSAVIKVFSSSKKKYLKINNEIINNTAKAIEFNPNLIIISNPSSLHIKTALSFANIKTNFFIEKPLSNNLSKISNLVSKINKNNLFLSIGYNLRFLPSLIRFRELINKNKIGNIYHFYSTVGYYLPHWRKNRDYRSTVSANNSLGGGVLLELSHEIDYIRWIFGQIESVYSIISKQSNLKIDVEDTSILMLNFKQKNLIGTIVMDFIRKDNNRECFAIGQKGSLKWDGVRGSVDFFDEITKKWKNIYNGKNEMQISYVNQWKDIIFKIENDNKPFVDIYDAMATIEVIEAAKLAHKKEKKININYKKI